MPNNISKLNAIIPFRDSARIVAAAPVGTAVGEGVVVSDVARLLEDAGTSDEGAAELKTLAVVVLDTDNSVAVTVVTRVIVLVG